jgi:arginase
MDVRILGVPLDHGSNRRGTDMGPSALRVANVGDTIRAQGHTVRDLGDVYTPTVETREVVDEGLRYLDEVVQVCENLARRVEDLAEDDIFPLIIGGDHSLSMGTVGGLARAGADAGVIWIDAHADYNTAKTSPSGNIHGMPLAALVGRGDDSLVGVGGVDRDLDIDDVVLVGVRSVDPGERKAIHETGLATYTMKDIDEMGMRTVMERAIDQATAGTDRLHVSLDLDSVDPEIAPGVGTPVRGGLSYREAHLALEMLAQEEDFRSLDVVELNPLIDERNRTADLAAELVGSAMGETIL